MQVLKQKQAFACEMHSFVLEITSKVKTKSLKINISILALKQKSYFILSLSLM